MKCLKCDTEFKTSIFKNGEYEVCKECIDEFVNSHKSIQNEVLSFVNFYRSSSASKDVKEACLLFYTDDELEVAKKCLLSKFSCLVNPAQRKDSEKRSKGEAIFKDILDMLVELDNKNIVVNCVAENLRRLPSYRPEEYNTVSILERLNKLEKEVKGNTVKIDCNATNIELLNTDIDNQSIIVKSIGETVSNNLAVDIVKNDITNKSQLYSSQPNSAMSSANNGSSYASSVVKATSCVTPGVTPQLKPVWQAQPAPFVKPQPSPALQTQHGPAFKPQFTPALQPQSATPPAASTGNIGFSSHRQQIGYTGANQGNVNSWQLVEKKKRKGCSVFGKGNINGKQLGAELPSRHFVLERILKTATKDDLLSYLKQSNPLVNIRSLELLTKSVESRYNMFKLEVCIEDITRVMEPTYIPAGVGIRPYWFRRQSTNI